MVGKLIKNRQQRKKENEKMLINQPKNEGINLEKKIEKNGAKYKK